MTDEDRDEQSQLVHRLRIDENRIQDVIQNLEGLKESLETYREKVEEELSRW